jgi:hypothetical protein
MHIAAFPNLQAGFDWRALPEKVFACVRCL